MFIRRIWAPLLAFVLIVAPATPSLAKRPAAPPQISGQTFSFADLAEDLRKSVVNIRVTQRLQGPGGQMFFNGQPIDPNDPDLPDVFKRFFGYFGSPEPPERHGQGSGVIISSDGYIATNHHVVDDANEITVVLFDETEYDGKVIGTDPKTDLALVKIEPRNPLPAVDFGDSDALRVGEWVMAIGNPFGLSETVTAGIVSAKGRVIGAGPYDDFIQTDASINPGNSGGPLFNLDGDVVGINTAISAQGQGIGFAIPSNIAKVILDQLKESGSVTRGWLGVGIQPLTNELADSMNLPNTHGALVTQVYTDTPAAKAGFEPEDVIIEYNGVALRHSSDLPKLVAHTPPGTKARITVLRKGKKRNLAALISELQETDAVARRDGSGGRDQKSESAAEYGLEVATLTPQLAREVGSSETAGILITGVASGSPAERTGLAKGDIILDIQRKPVRSVEELEKVLKSAGDGRLLLRVARGDQYLFAVLRPKR